MRLKLCIILLLFFVETLLPKTLYYSKFLQKEITASLTLNYYHLDKGKCYLQDYPTSAILDSTCQYDIVFENTNKTLEVNEYIYQLYSYQFSFDFSCSKDNWLTKDGESIYYTKRDIHLDGFERYLPINLLHMNGLIGYDSLAKRYINISGTSLVNEIDISLLKIIDSINVNNVIELKYYNYKPSKIVLDLNENRFSFYSVILKRRMIGNVIYDPQFDSYKLRLENGILINN